MDTTNSGARPPTDKTPIDLAKGPRGPAAETGRLTPTADEPTGLVYQLIRWPIRIVAVLVLLPARLVWELAGAIGRVAWTVVVRWLLVPFGRAAERVLWEWCAVPLGRGLAALGRGLRRVVWGRFLAPVGRGLRIGALAVGRAVRWVSVDVLARGVVLLVRHAVVLPLRVLGRRVLAPLGAALFAGLRAVARACVALIKAVGRIPTLPAWMSGRAVRAAARWVGRLLHVLLVAPARRLWRGMSTVVVWWLLVPLGRGLAALGRGLRRVVWGRFLAPVGRGLRIGALAVGRAMLAALNAAGRALRWALIEVLVRGVLLLVRHGLVLPLRVLGRRVLAPLGAALFAGLRAIARAGVASITTSGRVLAALARALGRGAVVAARWVGRALYVALVVPTRWAWRVVVRAVRACGRACVSAYRTLVVAPAVWARDSVLAPTGRAVGSAWRGAVAPWGRMWRTVAEQTRLAGRDVRRALGKGRGGSDR